MKHFWFYSNEWNNNSSRGLQRRLETDRAAVLEESDVDCKGETLAFTSLLLHVFIRNCLFFWVRETLKKKNIYDVHTQNAPTPRTPNKMMQNGIAKCIYYVNEKK